MPDLFIFGTGQIGEVANYYFNLTNEFEKHFFVADDEYVREAFVDGLPVLSLTEAKLKVDINEDQFFTAFSARKKNKLRQEKAESLAGLGYRFASYVHPTATLWTGFNLPLNSMILENNVIQFKSSLGSNSIVWSNSHIGHHTKVGANTFITSEVVISGNCEIGDNTFFGVNSTTFDGVSIGSYSVVGAGAVVRRNLEDNQILVK